VKFENAYDILVRLDNQKQTLNEYLSNPSKLSNGPDPATYQSLINEQRAIIPKIKECINNLEKIKRLGDQAGYLDNMISYLNARLDVEENTMLKIIELLENGMSPEESKFLFDKTNQLLNLQKQHEKLIKAEYSFLKEFEITESDIEVELLKKGTNTN
jgi:sugar-specific transcriptional regulator TrmB